MVLLNAKKDHLMTPRSIAFLREIEMPEEALDILVSEVPPAITGDVLASYLRVAYDAGRRSARDVYRWHAPAELIGAPRGW